MSIRFKILSGFLVLSIMLVIAGLWSINQLNSLGSSVQKLINDNYQSINAAKIMNDALEREDSAILLLLHGKWKEGRNILLEADSIFNEKLRFASANITIEGEEEHLNVIKNGYAVYKKLWERPIVDTPKEGNLDWYFNDIHPVFSDLKKSIDRLLTMNNEIMYQITSDVGNRSSRAIMPGIVAIIASLTFTFLFTYFINYYIVSPIIRITKEINEFKRNRKPYIVKIETKDEIYRLSEAIDHLCESVKNKEI